MYNQLVMPAQLRAMAAADSKTEREGGGGEGGREKERESEGERERTCEIEGHSIGRDTLYPNLQWVGGY